MPKFYLKLYNVFVFRKPEQGGDEEDRKITRNDLEKEVEFRVEEIKPDIDAMAVQIFTDLPEDNPFQLAGESQETVYQPLTLEDPHNDVTHALEGKHCSSHT